MEARKKTPRSQKSSHRHQQESWCQMIEKFMQKGNESVATLNMECFQPRNRSVSASQAVEFVVPEVGRPNTSVNEARVRSSSANNTQSRRARSVLAKPPKLIPLRMTLQHRHLWRSYCLLHWLARRSKKTYERWRNYAKELQGSAKSAIDDNCWSTEYRAYRSERGGKRQRKRNRLRTETHGDETIFILPLQQLFRDGSLP